MKFSQILVFTFIVLLLSSSSTFELGNLKSQEESSLLFNSWKKVPGATTAKPTYLSPTVAPLVDNGFANVLQEGWLNIASPSFKDTKKFPVIKTKDDGVGQILLSPKYMRLNEKYLELLPSSNPNSQNKDAKTPPDNRFFYFRLSSQFLYFSVDKDETNILFNLKLANLLKDSLETDDQKCFRVMDREGIRYDFCADSFDVLKKFLCEIQLIFKLERSAICYQTKPPEEPALTDPNSPQPNGGIIEKVITQPYILIPTAQKGCNEKWDYSQNGRDWQCKCKEGKFYFNSRA